MSRTEVEAAFPELDAIEDDELRRGVIAVWTSAMEEGHVDDLSTVPWFPPVQRELDLPDERLVDHVRDVTEAAIALAEVLTDRRGDDPGIDLDLVVAGALVHDASKLVEFAGMETTPVGELLGHPHYGVHLVAAAGLPAELAHVVLSHSGRTAVEPATLEAAVVRRADEVAAAAIRMRALQDLRDA